MLLKRGRVRFSTPDVSGYGVKCIDDALGQVLILANCAESVSSELARVWFYHSNHSLCFDNESSQWPNKNFQKILRHLLFDAQYKVIHFLDLSAAGRNYATKPNILHTKLLPCSYCFQRVFFTMKNLN